MKRLRHNVSKRGQKLRYYLVGEYGSKTKRPHYHAIIMNATEAEIQSAWIVNNEVKGFLHFGNVESASVGYTLKYMMKDYRKKYTDEREPTFSLMSKGLGLSYVTDEVIKWHHSDLSRVYCVLPGGVKIPIPRYYKNRIFTPDQLRRQSMITDAAIAFGSPDLEFDEIMLQHKRIKHWINTPRADHSHSVL